MSERQAAEARANLEARFARLDAERAAAEAEHEDDVDPRAVHVRENEEPNPPPPPDEDDYASNGDPPPVFNDDPDLDAFLDTDEPDFDWLVDGLLERGDRVIVTGQEGNGKSTLLRQLGVQLASGLHPFTGEDIDPMRVLLIDCENSRRQARRALRPLRDAAGDAYRDGRLRLQVLGHALELADSAVYCDLATRIHRYAVDVLLLGPLYKLIEGDPVKEVPAKDVADALDRLRQERGSAIIIEAHSPYAEGAKSKRPIRPYGASLWSRWPEFGVYLGDDGTLDHWRGQREQRAWPARLERSQPWPWAAGEAVEQWDGPTRCMAEVVNLLAAYPADEFSKNALGDKLRAIGSRWHHRTITEAVERLAGGGRIGHRKGPRGADLYHHGGGQESLDVQP